MQYGLAFSYITSRRGGFGNLLLLTVCLLIPVVGPIVLLGYRAEVAEALNRDPNLRRHPKFEFNLFGEYLTRGIWPFVTGLVIGIPIGAVFFVVIIAGMAAGQNGAPPGFMLALFALLYIVVIPLYMAVSVPMMFHSQLTAKFDLGGAFRFTRSFWSLVGGKAFVAGLVYFPLSIIVMFVGLLACFVGIYPAATLTQMASEHLMVQLYREYVDRGGEPITDDIPPRLRDDDEYEDDDRRGDERW